MQLYVANNEEVSEKKDETSLTIKFLGTALILLITGIVVCFLASLGYNTYIKYSDNKKNRSLCKKPSNTDFQAQ